MSVQTETTRHTVRSLAQMKGRERIAMLTAYDVVTASCLDAAGVDLLLVGDSLGNVIYGFESTLPVSMDMILAHTAAVVRGSRRALVVADLPFMSYQASVSEAVRNAARCLSQAGAQAVKLEGAGPHVLRVIERCMEAGIPVMGHVGLTPQSVHKMGGYYTHGKDEHSAARLRSEARLLQAAGCFSVVLECVTGPLAAELTNMLHIPTIGIGSGSGCDGEVLVINDVLGYSPGRAPKFAAPRMDLKRSVTQVAREFVLETKSTEQCAPSHEKKGGRDAPAEH